MPRSGHKQSRAAAAAPLPVAAAAHQLVQVAVPQGHRDEDFAALLVEQARSAGIELAPEDVEVDDRLTAQ